MAESFFKLSVSQKYVLNLEGNWINYVCVGVKNFSNL